MVGRLVATSIVGLAMIVASNGENVIDIAVFMLGLSSAELTANWAQWWWWRFNGPARLAASFGGPLLFLFNQFVVFRYFIDAGPASVYLVVFTSMARDDRALDGRGAHSPSPSRKTSWSSSTGARGRWARGDRSRESRRRAGRLAAGGARIRHRGRRRAHGRRRHVALSCAFVGAGAWPPRQLS